MSDLIVSPSYVQPEMFSPQLPDWPFEGLEPFAYSLIMIDPPWHFKTRSKKGDAKSPQAKYRTMTVDAIRALPVADLATKDSLLWMWGTGPMLDVQISIMESWGYKFKTAGTWVKTTRHGKIAFGTGYLLRQCAEYYLIGTRGKPKTVSKSVRSAFLSPLREHSRKPESSYEMARKLVPYGRAADLFSRQSREGWENWGDEKDLFDGDYKRTSFGKPRSRRGIEATRDQTALGDLELRSRIAIGD